MLQLASFLLIVLTGLSLWAQSPRNLQLHGTITDAVSGRALPGARITVAGGLAKRDEVSESNGSFNVELKDGITVGSRIRIRVEKEGYGGFDQSFAASDQVSIAISLTPIVGPNLGKRGRVRNPENLSNTLVRLSSAQSFLKRYGASTVTVVDASLRNDSGHPINLTRFRVNVEKVFEYNYDPCPTCLRLGANGVYTLSFRQILEGARDYEIFHLLRPGSTERIDLVFGGSEEDLKSYLARITIQYGLDSGKEITTTPLDILVQNFDQGTQVPLNSVGEQRLRTFIEGGTNPPVLLTPSVLRKFFKDG